MTAILERPLHGATAPHLAFDLYRVPFFLEPDYPEDEAFHESNRDRLVKKWGGDAGWAAQKKRHGLKERGLDVGIAKFNLDRHASNTLPSHVLVQWAANVGGLEVSEAVYDKLNELHFVQGKRLNDRKLLVSVAAEVGLDGEAADAFLESGEGHREVKAMYQKVLAAGVQSIPTFVVDGGNFVINGAAKANELEECLRAIEKEVVDQGKLARPPPVFGHALKQSLVM